MHFFYKIRFLLLLLTLLAGAALWPGVQRALVVDNSLTVWFLEDDPGLRAYHDFQDRFGNDEVVVLMVHDATTLLTPAYFKAFTALSDSFEALPDVDVVIGPGNAALPAAGLFGVQLKPILTEETTPESLQETLASQPTLRESLFTPDYKTARFVITLKSKTDFDTRRGEILSQIKAVANRQLPQRELLFGGVGIIYAALNTLSQSDFGFFLGVGYLLMFALFTILYRKPLLILYTIGIVILSTYFTLGLYGAAGYRLNLMTVLLPILLMLLGIMDAIHVINERSQLAGQPYTSKESALFALQRTFAPCLFTSLINAVGFLALLTSPMAILKTFGLFAAVGILLSLFFTYLLGVLLLPFTKPASGATAKTGVRIARFAESIIRRKKLFWSLFLGLFLFFAGGMALLKTDTYTLGYLPENHPAVQDHQQMERTWGAYMPLELMVKPKGGLPLYSVDVVRSCEAFTDSVTKLSGMGRVFGFHTLYRGALEARYGINGTRLLGSAGALKQAHLQLQMGYPRLVQSYLHEADTTGRITLSGKMLSAGQLSAKMDSVMQIANATLGTVATITPAGYQPMYANIVNYVTQSQVTSLLLAAGLVFFLVWLFIRNLKLAALTVAPNLFPVLVILGTMGWLGIYLDTATASIGAIVLSFCVDDSVHFIWAYQQSRRAGLSPEAARWATLTHVGPAIVLAALVLFSGYFLMVFGSLKTVQFWGVLTSIAIVAALFGELVLFPLVLDRFDRKSKL
jgi:predicted RND superfamily exporter protein